MKSNSARVKTVLVSSAALLSFAAILLLGSRWANEPVPFSPESWRSNTFWGDRWVMAKGLVRDNALRGKTEADVKELLGFAEDRSARETVGTDGTKTLSVDVSGRCKYGWINICLKNDRVVNVWLVET